MDRGDPALSADDSLANGGDEGGGARRGLTRRIPSASNIIGMTERPAVELMSVSRVNALRASVGKHCDTVIKILMTSKESSKKRSQIESAFWTCKEAFMEVSTVLVNVLEEKSTGFDTLTVNMKKAIDEAFNTSVTKWNHSSHGTQAHVGADKSKLASAQQKTYSSVVESTGPCVCISRGPTIDVPRSISFLVIPDDKSSSRFASSRETREALFRSLKPAQCGVKVSKVTSAPNNGVRIEAIMPDLNKN